MTKSAQSIFMVSDQSVHDVQVLGHGSSSTNNPFYAAYQCGACQGKDGAPNARLLARLANDTTVTLSLSTGHILSLCTLSIHSLRSPCTRLSLLFCSINNALWIQRCTSSQSLLYNTISLLTICILVGSKGSFCSLVLCSGPKAARN